MDRESSATYIEPSPDVSVENSKKLIHYIRSMSTLPTSSPLITPVITPRFAISCTDRLLECLGDLASSDCTLPIQTHISENHEEIEKTLCLFPKARNYAEVYEMFGLLRHNTILGHACHFNEDEIKLVKQRDAGIAHCPTSNFNIRSGIAPIGLYLDRGIKVSDTETYSRVSLIRESGRSRDGRFGRLRAVHDHGDAARLNRLQSSLFL
jgi:guanine deaminase